MSGKGAEITDVNGHVVIDCNNNYTSLIHGHADPEILQIVSEVAAEGTAFGLPTATKSRWPKHCVLGPTVSSSGVSATQAPRQS